MVERVPSDRVLPMAALARRLTAVHYRRGERAVPVVTLAGVERIGVPVP